MKNLPGLIGSVLLAAMLVTTAFAADKPQFVLKSNHWAQLVIPADSSVATVRELFADKLSADEYRQRWIVYLYDVASGSYVNPGLDGVLPTGVGFWIFQLTNTSVSLDVPAEIPAANTSISQACSAPRCFAVPLASEAGLSSYSNVGSPLPAMTPVDQIRLHTSASDSLCQNGCSLQEAVELQYLSAPLWHYDSATKAYIDLAVVGQVEPWQSFWVLTKPALVGAAHLLFPDSPPATAVSPERAEASRFLAQATFGPTTASINALLETNYSDWIDRQMNLPVTSMLDSFDTLQLANPASAPSRDWVFESFWTHAVKAPDQLRQRVAFALSQLFVVSLREGAVASIPRGVADYYSLLAKGAFGNFRSLLEQVALHPVMGSYLSHLGNEKGDAQTGRVPDENFAREIMQLFTIGLYDLQNDGSLALSPGGSPIETYSNADVQGLARVFTGFSWNGPDTSTGRFQGWIGTADRDVRPMQGYARFHSTLEKRFLGTVIDAQNDATPEADLAKALDALFNHPNVGPFIGKQLIQRLVTSNPGKDYVRRVTAVFNNNGEGVRGDLRAVIRAILLDPEARDVAQANAATSGRIREPILRFAHWMRSFNATADTGRYTVLGTDDPATSLGMTVLRSPSVFNFYRPGYRPPNTPVSAAGLVSPEMQITHETSIAGYLNFMLNAVELGTGTGNSISSEYSEAIALGTDPKSLVDYLNILLLHGSMSGRLQAWLAEAIETIDINANTDLFLALQQRARLAVYLTMASPEYIVLK